MYLMTDSDTFKTEYVCQNGQLKIILQENKKKFILV
jgi:hypothetical protein